MLFRSDDSEIDHLVAAYTAGHSVAELAAELGVHRTTILHHLEQRGIARRRFVRKLSDFDVAKATADYAERESLATIASRLDVDPETVRREFLKAGVKRRSPRRHK